MCVNACGDKDVRSQTHKDFSSFLFFGCVSGTFPTRLSNGLSKFSYARMGSVEQRVFKVRKHAFPVGKFVGRLGHIVSYKSDAHRHGHDRISRETFQG